MRYMGSKSRLAKDIAPIILQNLKKDQWYVEPFVGSFGMMDKIYHPYRIANDYNFYIIELYKSIRDGWIPPNNVSEEEYNHIRKNKDQYPSHLVGFVGYACSFGAKWFGGYARGKNSKGEYRNYALESKKSLLLQKKNLYNIDIYNMSYDELEIPSNSLIYCDPPYKDTTSYNAVDSFDHNKFYDWCRQMKNEGHFVYISEYNMPDDFECIWSKKMKISIHHDKEINKHNIERLFVI